MATWKKVITSGSRAEFLAVSASDGIVPVKDDAVDLGSAALEFKDLYVDGTAYLDTANIAAGTITGITDLVVADGGTGAGTFTDGGILLGSGTGAITAMSVLADGEFVVGDGTTDPVAESGDTARISLGVGSTSTWQITGLNIGAASDTTLTRPSAGDLQIESNIIYRAGGTDVAVADGGTGVGTLTNGGVLLGSGTGAITAMSVLADSEMIVGDGSTDPVAESGATLRTSIGVGTTDNVKFAEITASSHISSSGNVYAGKGGSFVIGAADMNEADLEKLDGITDGTAAANKAVVLDGSKNIATIGTVGCGAITSTGTSQFGRVSIDSANDYIDVSTDLQIIAAADITLDPAGGNVKPGGDSADDLGVSGTAWRTLYADNVDLDGQGRLDLDDDQDTSIRASADDVITFEAGAVDIAQMTATKAISGSSISTGSFGYLNVDGTINGTVGAATTATTATVATTVTVTDNENTDEDNVVTFVAGADADGGNVGLESDGNFHYNPSTGLVTATGFSGNLTGTLQTATQNSVTTMTGLVTVSALNSGTITSGFGTINNGSSTITTTGLISGGSLDIDDVLINGTTIGHTDDTDLITVANGAVTIAGTLSVSGDVDFGGDATVTNVTSSNLIVGDAFMFLSTGSAARNLDSGLIVQSGSADLTGSALYHDTDAERWAVAKSVSSITTGSAALEYIVTVNELGDNDDPTTAAQFSGDLKYGVGEMAINSNGSIWIYS